jgi:hypothetical protein
MAFRWAGRKRTSGAEGRFDISFLVERLWCGMPVVPASPEARGAERPLYQPVPSPVVRNARQMRTSPMRRRVPGSAGCAGRVPCGDEHQAMPVMPNESCAECSSGETLYHSIEAAAQPARGVDAAARPQDRCFFDGWNRLERLLDLQGGATHAQAVGRHQQRAASTARW